MLLKPVVDQFVTSDEFAEFKKTEKGKKISIEGVAPSSFSLLAASIFHESPGQLILITENPQKMQNLCLDISCYVNPDIVYSLPPWETLPYEFVSPPTSTERDRITAIHRILSNEPYIIVTTVESVIRKLPHKEFFLNKGIKLEINTDYPFDDIIEMLVTYGYRREARVEGFGHFSVKGGIIDIFLPSKDYPIRLDFFGDTLESIREFDINSQISHTKLASVTIYPERELILFEKEKRKLREILLEAKNKKLQLTDEMHNYITEMESGNKNIPPQRIKGIEDIFPLIMDSASLPDYFRDKARVILIETPELLSQKASLEKTFNELYRKKKDSILCVPPKRLMDYSAFDRIRENAISIQTFTTTQDYTGFSLKSIPGFRGKIKDVREEISSRIEKGWEIIVTTGFEGQARRLYDLLSGFDPDSDFTKINKEKRLNILISPLREGIEVNSVKILLITDHEIFGKSYRKKKQFKKRRSKPIGSFLDLSAGDYIVHINHGIGIFRGIERTSAGGVERDFLLIEYAESDRLFIPLDQLTMVQKYIGIDGRKPRIDSLGKRSSWNRIKRKVQENVEEIAKELMKIYSKRSAIKGYRYPPDSQWQEEFESMFEYEETPDQISAIEDVKDDMEMDKPMDRLICGDVGFGKTEIAIRAAFKAVMAGRQVAILVPTTILAMQHFATFKKRFEEYPIEIDMMSRFRTPSQIKIIKKKLAGGYIDIIIGTHSLISKDIKIKNLGLLIIDEEQKFGVKHKEQLKLFRTQVDVLTLTATPIPRTLHMSMSGIRDLSIISTPPENRQSINTYVMEENPDILRNAIISEIKRKGQVFFVHNRVGTIEAAASMLEKLVPEATYCIAHGQMDEQDLEDIMLDFVNKKYDVLVSTTIIESGLDIPNVNTIIINRADTFGLSQRYQLKGRVGRSVRKSYAYLFYPKHISLTEEAQKRLQVISEYSELGSGFKIAMKDLEIRGAGNILGKEQSGSIMEVGFELYCKMLEDAVKNLKGEKPESLFRTSVFINTDLYIPDTYISDTKQKIEFYKRFESCGSIEEVDNLKDQLIDRFGTPPPQVNILVELEKIRALASSLLIDEVIEDSRAIKIRISAHSKIDPQKIVKLITTDSRISIDPGDSEKLIFTPKSQSPEKIVQELKKWLQQLT